MDLEKLLFTAASGEEVTLQPFITSLDFDFENLCEQLSMLPDIIKAAGSQDKSGISVRFISEATNTVPGSKTLLSEVHKLLKLLSFSQFLSQQHQLKDCSQH